MILTLIARPFAMATVIPNIAINVMASFIPTEAAVISDGAWRGDKIWWDNWEFLGEMMYQRTT